MRNPEPLLSQANKLYTAESQQRVVRQGIATALRAPTKAYSVLQNSAVYSMLQKAARRGIPNAPPFLMSIIETIASKSAPNSFRLFKELESMAPAAKSTEKAPSDDNVVVTEVEALKAELALLKEENERLKKEG